MNFCLCKMFKYKDDVKAVGIRVTITEERKESCTYI